jgi:hypothetical protein
MFLTLHGHVMANGTVTGIEWQPIPSVDVDSHRVRRRDGLIGPIGIHVGVRRDPSPTEQSANLLSIMQAATQECRRARRGASARFQRGSHLQGVAVMRRNDIRRRCVPAAMKPAVSTVAGGA